MTRKKLYPIREDINSTLDNVIGITKFTNPLGDTMYFALYHNGWEKWWDRITPEMFNYAKEEGIREIEVEVEFDSDFGHPKIYIKK